MRAQEPTGREEAIRPRHAIVCHGAGSSGAAARLLVPPEVLGAREVAYPEDRTGDVDEIIGVIDAWDRALDDDAERVVAGISLGAHAAARWAARRRPQGSPSSQPSRPARRPDPPLTLMLALPAWSGPPGPAAAATRASAEQVRRHGIDAVLADLAATDLGDRACILELLRLAWSEYDADVLADALGRAAAGRGPTNVELGALRCRTAVAWWEDDPFHPAEVGLAWSRAIPGAHAAHIPWTAMTDYPGTLGTIAAGLLGLHGSRAH